MVLVGPYDLTDEFVADDVGVLEVNEADTLDGCEGLDRLDQARFAAMGEIDLGGIAGDDAFGFGSEAGKEHEHLFGGGVLAFVEDDEGAVESATAHVGEGGDLEDSLIHHLLDFFDIEHIVEGVVEGAEVRENLFLEISREEAEGFPCFDGGAGEDDTTNLIGFEVGDSKGHGEVGLTGAGRADAEGEIVVANGVDVRFLKEGFREDGWFFCGDLNSAGPDAFKVFAFAAMDRLEGIAKFVAANAETVLVSEVELAEKFLG